MDPIKILKRAWYILWSYRALWVFGLILALAGAGAQGNSNGSMGNDRGNYNNNYNGTTDYPGEVPHTFQEFVQQVQGLLKQGLTELGIPADELSTLLWIGAIFLLFMFILGIAMAFARYVSETAVIRMVDEYESTGTKMTVREGFRLGWSRTSWRLFLINLIVNLPLFLTSLLFLVIGIIVLVTLSNSRAEPAIALVIAAVIVVFVVIFVVAIYSIVMSLLRNFFWRIAVLEDAGVRESLRRGLQMARTHWKNIGIMWLVMIGLGILWAILSVIAFVILIPAVVVTAVAGALVAVVPALLVGGITSIFVQGWVAWAIGALFALPLFFTVAFSPWLLLTGWQVVFTSTVWTLVYRELKALPALTSENTALPDAAAQG